MIRLARYAALVLATFMVLALLWQFGEVVWLFLLSLAIEAAFHPLVEKLQQRGLRRGFAVAASYGTVLLVVGGLFWLASGPLVVNLQEATDDSLISYTQLKNRWLQKETPLLNSLAEQMPTSEALYSSITGEKSGVALQTLFGAAEGTFGFLSKLALVIVLSVYWSMGHIQFERLWLSLLPVEGRARARSIWLSVQTEVGACLRREVTLSLLAGILLWLVYLTLGIRYAALIATIAALARLIPWLGSLLVVVLPFLVGSTIGLWAGLSAAAFTLLVLAVLEVTLGNKIFPRQRYSSYLLVLLMIAMADSYGLKGAIFAPVLTVALQNLFGSLLVAHMNAKAGFSSQTLVNLHLKMEKINGVAKNLDAPNSTEVASLAARLEGLLDKISAAVRTD